MFRHLFRHMTKSWTRPYIVDQMRFWKRIFFFFYIKINSGGFISVERSKLLSGVHKCFYLSPQFCTFSDDT